MAKKRNHGGVTVAQLIEWLKGLDQTRVVVVSKDPEGNSFRPLDEGITSDALFDVTEGDLVAGEDLEEMTAAEKKKLLPVVCLWPGYWSP